MILHSESIETNADSEVLLLIHGMGSGSVAWKPISAELARQFRVILVDLPGHGKTPLPNDQPMDPMALAEAVFETMDSQGITKFHIVGNSLGGWIALEMAVLRPAAVLSLTALAPAGLWLEPFKMRNPGTTIARMLANSLRVVSPLLLRHDWARNIGFENVSPLWRNFSYELCLDATNAFATATGYLPAWDAFLNKRFDKVIDPSVRLTVIFGDSDRSLPASNCQEKSLLPNHAKWIVFSQCGHAPMWDHPMEVIEEILVTTGHKS